MAESQALRVVSRSLTMNMVDLERKRLLKEPRGSVTVSGRAALILSLPLISAGTLIILVSERVVPLDLGIGDFPQWIITSFGAVLLGAGILTLFEGLWGLVLQARRKGMILRHPGEPWYADHPWDPYGIRDDGLPQTLRGLIGTLLFVLFLLPINGVAFFLQSESILIICIVGLFDLIVAGSAWYGLYKLIRVCKYGRSSLKFKTFPAHPGETIELQFQTRTDLSHFESIDYTLRFVEEILVTTRSARSSRTSLRCYQLYSETQTVEGAEAVFLSGLEKDLSFEIPDRGLITNLSKNPPSYWELEIKAAAPGIDFLARFPLPIYEGQPSREELQAVCSY
ncbi:MAG: hypothetical protein ACE5F1_03055 [Planctomycetota bacterium]